MTDEEFDLHMERIAAGEKDALHEVYVAYGPYIYHLLLGILQNREDAEDVASEFFIKLWKNAGKYKPGNGHKAYLSTIAHHMAIDFLRAHKQEIPTDFEENPQKEGDGNVSYPGRNISAASVGGLFSDGIPPGDVTAREAVSKLSMEEALSKLKPAEREIVHLKIVAELTFEEIARVTGAPMGTVAWRYREAIKKLKKSGYGTGF